MATIEYIYPDWPAHTRVKTATTTRLGGVSQGRYASFNLGDHVGDAPEHVRRNRQRLRDSLKLPVEPVWLKQVHGRDVVDAAVAPIGAEADGSYTRNTGVVCAVMTADCLPVFLCDRGGTAVALLHAGWRGLAAGVIEAGVDRLGADRAELLAWLGPAIGPKAFEVGDEVRDGFVRHDHSANAAFQPSSPGRWFADLYSLGRQRLEAAGVTAIYGGDRCTFHEKDKFFSYRRDRDCGRMASLIWLED